MKTRLSALLFAAALAVSSLMASGHASAADQAQVVGPVNKITLAADGMSATAEIKDVKTGETVVLTISDELTLDKFKDKRIVEGDEIRARYINASPRTAKSFRKTAGC